MSWLNSVVISGVLSLVLVIGAKSWHDDKVNSAVTSAVLQRTQEINAKYAERLNDLKVEQKLNQEHLNNLTQASLKEKQNALQNSTTK